MSVPADVPMEESEQEDIAGDAIGETNEVAEVLASPEPLPIQVKRPVRGQQRVIRGRGTKENPYLIGFHPIRACGVPLGHPYLPEGHQQVSSRVSSGHSTTPDDSDTIHGDRELGHVNQIHPADSTGRSRAQRTHFVAEMATNPNGWGIGWELICTRDVGVGCEEREWVVVSGDDGRGHQ